MSKIDILIIPSFVIFHSFISTKLEILTLLKYTKTTEHYKLIIYTKKPNKINANINTHFFYRLILLL